MLEEESAGALAPLDLDAQGRRGIVAISPFGWQDAGRRCGSVLTVGVGKADEFPLQVSDEPGFLIVVPRVEAVPRDRGAIPYGVL